MVRDQSAGACGALIAYIALLVLQNKKQKALLLFVVGTVALLISFSFALALGGQSIEQRGDTLFEDDPMTVYYSNGARRSNTVLQRLLSQYPVGAGLGRWGMMRAYFGDESNLDSPPIWAELQPNAWILDGGLMLLLFYLTGGGARTP